MLVGLLFCCYQPVGKRVEDVFIYDLSNIENDVACRDCDSIIVAEGRLSSAGLRVLNRWYTPRDPRLFTLS